MSSYNELSTPPQFPPITEPYTVIDDLSKASIYHIRQLINAYLNTKGGIIIIGFNEYLAPIGVYFNVYQRDYFRCRIDSLINASQPQVDSDCVSVQFFELRKSTYVVYIAVRPGPERVYYTCYAKAYAFTIAHDRIRMLSPAEVLRRYQISRVYAVELEESEREIIIQEQVIYDAVIFSQNDSCNTRVICLEGPQHSGKTWLIHNIKYQISFDISLEVNFKKFVYLDEVYLELIRQFYPTFYLTFKLKHIKIVPNQKIQNIEDLFSDTAGNQEDCVILENIYMNMFQEDTNYLLVLQNIDIAADRFIPKGKQLTVLATSNSTIVCDQGPACQVLHLDTKQMNAKELMYLVKNQENVELTEEFANRLLTSCKYDTSMILSKIQASKDDLRALEDAMMLQSGSSLMIFQNDSTNEERKLLEPLSIIPDKFNLSLASYFVQVKYLFSISKYLTAKNGYYRIDNEIREFLLALLDEEQEKLYYKYLINYYIEEITQINQYFKDQKKSENQIKMQIFYKNIYDWINHNLINMEGVLKMSISLGYKEIEFYDVICTMLTKRVTANITQQLDIIGEKYHLSERSD